MPKRFDVSLSISGLLSIRGGKSPRPSSRPARLTLAALGGFVLVGLWLSIMARAQDNAQASSPLEPCSTGPAIVAGAHSSTGTLPNRVITAASDPLCTNADLTVAKTVNNTIPDVGKAITYTVMMTNAGPDDASGVQLTDVLPESAIFRSATPQDVCTEENNTVTCDLGHLPNGDSALVTIVVTPTQAGTITNVASVTSDASDPDPGNNTAERTARVTGADLVVTKAVNITAPKAGDSITYTITVANNGPDNATEVRVTDTLPAGVTFSGYTATRGTYITDTDLWSVGNLANAARATMTIAASVISCTGYPTMPNTASISAAWPNDPNLENNESRAVITPTSGVYCLYLPIIFKNYEPIICTPYFDDFSDPNSGWCDNDRCDNNGDAQTGYSVDGKFFIRRYVSGMRVVQAPVGFANHYTVEVDVRWDSANVGYEYGLIFGQVRFPVPTYRFGVDPVNQRYRLKYHNGRNWECINQSDPCWVKSSSITSTASISNHLKVKCNGTTVSLYANGELLWKGDSDIPSCAGQVGLFAQSSPTVPNALAYFDNFRVSCPLETGPLDIVKSNVFSVSTMSADLDVDE
jgi:uncharacterized repeat protein (TIGR01451 family)